MSSFQSRDQTPAHLRPDNTTDAIDELERFEQEAGNSAAQEDAGLGAAGPPPTEEATGPFENDELNEALSLCFGESLDGLSADWGGDDGAVASTTGNAMSFGPDMSENADDPETLGVVAHEAAHALAGGGSGATAIDAPGDAGESAADRAESQFASFARSGFQGPAPSLSPAAGGRAATHRKRGPAVTVLREGSKGPRVTHVQQRLRYHGHRVAVDGDFGPNTEAAVVAFQKSKGLAADGAVGPQTLAALDQAKAPQQPSAGHKPAAPREAKVTGDPPLREGSRGAQVRALQKLLRISVDGEFGPATERAVKAFQTRKGLTPDGVVGPVTARVLNGGKPPEGSGLRYMVGNGGRTLGLVRRQGEWMLPATASAFDRMNAFARERGVHLVIKDGFRSYREQVEIAHRLGIYGHGGLAAVPGTSNHGLGVALDLWDGRGYDWLAKYAPRFGFRRTVAGEPWHWEV